MTIDELRAAIEAANASNQFVIRTEPMPDHQPSDKTVLEPAADGSGRWVVYYSERGQIWDPQYFDSEEAAADFVHARLTAPDQAARPTTPEEDAQAAELSAAAEQRRRQSLIDAGYDPDTLEPRGA